MTTLNETLANMFGREAGDLVYQRIEGAKPYSEESQETEVPQGDEYEEDFDFRLEMRKTRLRVGQLLQEGKIEEAEQYMEKRRLFFAEHGHFIRKLNQAYFAFRGIYSDDPASLSPIFQQLTCLRAASPSLGHFIRRVSSVSSYSKFLAMLDAEDGKVP